jgi:hypothetical protein
VKLNPIKMLFQEKPPPAVFLNGVSGCDKAERRMDSGWNKVAEFLPCKNS